MALTHFFSKIAGVSYPNRDGSSRQVALRGCRAGERLRLVREAENPHDDEAVAVVRATGEQLGYVTERANDDVSRWLDDGVHVAAFLTHLTGGGSGQNLGANLLIIAAEEGEGEEEILACAHEQLELDSTEARDHVAADPWSPQAVAARLPQYPRPEDRLELGAARVAAILAAPPETAAPIGRSGGGGGSWWWPWGVLVLAGLAAAAAVIAWRVAA